MISDEARMIGDAVAGMIATEDPAVLWARLAGAGMLGLAAPVGAGGAGLGMAELVPVVRALGRTPLPLPFLASEVLCLPVLAQLAGEPVRSAMEAAGNGTHLALALHDRAETPARREAGGYRLDGEKQLVLSAQGAGHFLLAARLEGRPALFLLPAGLPGLSLHPYAATGLGPAADLRLEGVRLPADALLLHGEAAADAIAAAEARGMLATAAQIVGALEEMLALTTDYLRARRQFGVPLASFQALQHAAVEMFVEIELASSMLDYGVLMIDAPAPARDLALAAVKLKANAAARLAGEAAVQLHGGIGMTMESRVGRLFARISVLRLLFGDDAACRRRLDGAGLLED